MLQRIIQNSILSQEITILKRFTNKEIKFYQYFLNKCKCHLENIIIEKNYILFFVKNEDYFYSIQKLSAIRKDLITKKILIIRYETNLLKLIFSLFPNIYLHNVSVNIEKPSGIINIIIRVLSYEERGIALGSAGEYIKVVEEIFKKYIFIQNEYIPIKIKCRFNPNLDIKLY